ncbi:AMP-binding protein [Planosporangium sp. 12N6]|uniref:AMP-binding protein n=1 Tax=Planosporangium spinosum TaxID=3402278 RepID=UPI003CF3B994
METTFLLRTLGRRGVLRPGRPDKVVRQLNALRRWSFTLAGQLYSAAARDPDRIAVIDETGPLTYRELTDQAQRLANGLRGRLGVRAGDRVGILCRNSVAMLESMLATSAIGADLVMINTGLGPGQLEAVLHDQAIRVLIHDDEFFELLAAVPPHVARVSADGGAWRTSPTVAGLIASTVDPDLPPPARPGRTIILTSGTTGTPKGARRPIPGFDALASVIGRIPMRVHERMFIAAPLFHTWGYSGLQVALALRATVALRRRFEPAETLAAIREHDCRTLLAVPVMLQRLLDAVPAAPFASPLKVVASSGSALPAPLVPRLLAVFGDVLYNLYGSTEAGSATIATAPELRADPTCAGRPSPGTRVLILDPDGNPLPPMHIGRILVGSEMVFDGYTNGDAGRESRDGLVDTGDLGHLTPDGLLHVVGRVDDMVVSGGENVYPSAVENTIAELPQVRDVAVVGVADDEYGQRLAAWIELYPGEHLDPEAVREYVRRAMARFSVPRDVYFVAELPRNATGKVMRRYLTAPPGVPYPTTPPGAPTNPPPARSGSAWMPGANDVTRHLPHLAN